MQNDQHIGQCRIHGGCVSEKIHWADVCAENVRQDIAHRVATGITPSGPIHIGNMREVVTGDLVYKAMVDRGLTAELIYIADDFDPLRKVYPFLPERYAEYIGMPLCDIPCPCGECRNYAEHFLAPFLNALDQMDVKPTVIRQSEQYRSGAYTSEIRRVIEHRNEIREILERVSGRTLPEDWSPFYPICGGCGRIINVPILNHDPERHLVTYRCDCGHEGVADYSKGEGKLVWRVDWPMRWSSLGVTVEPFGKDHAAAGGSYDTGKEIVSTVFNGEAPFPVMYEWISLKGKGAMASSTGVAITIDSMLEIVPPDVLRYLIARTRPEKAITFDPGMGLISLIDEYDRVVQAGDSREFEFCNISSVHTGIPVRHMVTVVQIAGNDEAILEILKRSGYDALNRDAILQQARRVKVWLDKYAPEMVKFEVQDKLPAEADSINEEERAGLSALLSSITTIDEWNAGNLHNAVYSAGEDSGVNPKSIFRALYLVFLGKERGPRLGWFLEALNPEFVTRRLIEAVNAGAE
jgi:lysyl-tRNA synthetase class 1